MYKVDTWPVLIHLFGLMWKAHGHSLTVLSPLENLSSIS